jgi:hypothetical protein
MDNWIVCLMLAAMAAPVIYTNIAYWKMTKAEREASNNAYNEHMPYVPIINRDADEIY